MAIFDLVRDAAIPLLELPDSVLGPIAEGLRGPRPVNDRGDVLDVQLHTLLFAIAQLDSARTATLPIHRARSRLRENARRADLAPCRLEEVEDRWIEGPVLPIRIRIYRPRAGQLPCLVYFHGGGCVLGDLDSHDRVVRNLAREAGCVAISVDYRLAPEHRFPAAVDDAVAAYRWIVEHSLELSLDPSSIAVGGDSSGACLATVVSRIARDEHLDLPCYQLLVYPPTDMRCEHPSHRLFERGFYLEEDEIQWFLSHYMGDKSRLDPRASPLLTEDLSGLPPARVITAGFDPLRDEGEEYAERLEDAGVEVVLTCEGQLLHGFWNMGGVCRRAAQVVEDTARELQTVFRR